MNDVSKAEAVLFASGDPLSAEKLAQALSLSVDAIPPLLDALARRYETEGSALQVLRVGDGYQLGTREEYEPVIRAALDTRRMQPLSSAALEVLTVIAYNQPASKGFVERVRGVDSSSIVNALVEKGLLEEAGRINVPGHPIGFRTTPLFLRVFGLETLEDLPAPDGTQLELTDGEETISQVNTPDEMENNKDAGEDANV